MLCSKWLACIYSECMCAGTSVWMIILPGGTTVLCSMIGLYFVSDAWLHVFVHFARRSVLVYMPTIIRSYCVCVLEYQCTMKVTVGLSTNWCIVSGVLCLYRHYGSTFLLRYSSLWGLLLLFYPLRVHARCSIYVRKSRTMCQLDNGEFFFRFLSLIKLYTLKVFLSGTCIVEYTPIQV